MASAGLVSLISRWFLKPGRETDAITALKGLARDVQAREPDTLVYLVHRPARDERLQSLPPVDGSSVLFFETYRSADAFLAHVAGPVFKAFLAEHAGLFAQVGGRPYTTVEFLHTEAGFVRHGEISHQGASPVAGRDAGIAANRHPAVMFEIIAKDLPAMAQFYARVFEWRYRTGTGGFHYVHFVAGSPPLLGGLVQADPTIPGFAPGHNFYLAVDRVEPVLDAAIAAGGSSLMSPTTVDGYRFAMFRDPEGNPVGLIEPFAD